MNPSDGSMPGLEMNRFVQPIIERIASIINQKNYLHIRKVFFIFSALFLDILSDF
jgi:hypothetical protein